MIESLYHAIVVYVTFYPIVTSVMWAIFSMTYKIRWEEHHHGMFPLHKPTVTILIPAYNEAKLIHNSLIAVSNLDYPDYEVIVVNDGSKDKTAEKVQPFLVNPRFRFLDKTVNQGKALALNDVISIANGEIIVVLDADAEPEPDFLHHMTWHFQHARVGAVTGHPRVRNTNNFLTRIQVIEFTSIIGLLRRSQRVWGRMVTVSGIASAFRKEALYDVNAFRPQMFTEDIDITWRLEKRHWDIRYEPRAVVWMHVPDTLKDFFSQRLRWARGLMQVLRVHTDVMKNWHLRRMWPMFIESCLSTFWNTAYGGIIIIELTLAPYGTSLLKINVFWMTLMGTASLLQLFLGGMLERKHDKDIFKFFGYAIFYPLFYWMFMFIVTWAALPIFWRKENKIARWSSERR